ncbi:MAG: hypothetical protein LBG57_05290 [Treponema sp.]|nr:hypothetical protein [Treponema sp.]
MKRFMLFALLALSFAAAVSAQGRDRWGRGFPEPQPLPAEQVTVTGNLTIVQGSLAVKSGDSTYLIPGLLRYTGFIDSLKDGAQVRLEGAATSTLQDAKIKVLRVSKLTIGGKDYDLARPQSAASAQPGPGGPVWPMMPQMRMRHNRGW